MNIRLYNTLTRSTEILFPRDPSGFDVYSCGPTVYHHAHLGNLRTYIASDILVRVLRLNGWNVRHVMNITDVGHLVSDADDGEDKMEVGAAREGRNAWEIAAQYTASFWEQCDKLNIVRPTIVCKATDHIPQQISMIEALERNGFTYRIDDGIYFDSLRMPNYGDFARLDVEGLQAGARVEGGKKRSKIDFALWKFSRGQQRQMEWDSPWGRGFPGWHIECSAMSTHYLGPQFDIHTGGIDHIPIHHTNEIAQSQCASGAAPFVRYWMHSNFLQQKAGERMAKSSNAFLTVYSLREQNADPIAFRLLCLRAHYRNEMKFTWEAFESATVQYRRLRGQVAALEADASSGQAGPVASAAVDIFGEAILAALNDDLATPVALTEFQRALSSDKLSAAEKITLVARFDSVFGLSLLGLTGSEPAPLDAEIAALVAERDAARAKRDWTRADAIRSVLEGRGYAVEDTPAGTSILRAIE